MVFTYDDFFTWLTEESDWNQSDVYIRQRKYRVPQTVNSYELLKVPSIIEKLPYKGLEKLQGKNLVVGSNSPRYANLVGQFNGDEHSSMEEMGWLSLQVFETEERKELKNGWLLPLVARIDSGPGPGISIEYCMGAGKYLGFDAKMTPTHSPKMRLGVRNF